MRVVLLLLALLSVACSSVQAEIYFHEAFSSLSDWVTSKHKSDYGKTALSAGKVFVNEQQEKGLQLTEDSHFYAISRKLPKSVSNHNKDLVISFSVKNEQSLTCGGAYLKFFSALSQKDFHSESAYWLMFGPDRCGSTNKVHVIFHYKGTNWESKKLAAFPRDTLTHVYTLHLRPDNSYELYVDGASALTGKLDEDWAFLGEREITDAQDTKPESWVDQATIVDAEDTKPSDWDNEPALIKDPDAAKPKDWDDEEDGEWETPMIHNPMFRGEWRAREIPNPAFKGVWEARKIPNPDYHEDPNLYRAPEPLQYVGIDVWQVEAGSIFDNIIISDSIQETLELIKKTYGSMAEKEKALVKEEMEKKQAAAEKAAKAAETAKAASTTEEDHKEDHNSDL